MAWADCEITVKGDGQGRHGHPKNDRTGPLRDFLVFNQVFFKAVRDHLKGCADCDPAEIMRVYLERVRSPPRKTVVSRTSATFIDHVTKLEKLLARKGSPPLPAEMVNEVWLRGGADRILARERHCSVRELALAYRMLWNTEGSRGQAQLRQSSRTFAVIARLLEEQAPGEGEYDRLIEVAEVMLS